MSVSYNSYFHYLMRKQRQKKGQMACSGIIVKKLLWWGEVQRKGEREGNQNVQPSDCESEK